MPETGDPRTELVLDVPGCGLLLDCDGVLVDSDAAVNEAWEAWAERYDLDVGDVLARVHGVPARQTVAAYLDPGRRATGLALVERMELETADLIQALPGALNLLSALPTGTWAVVTSGTSALARARLLASGLPMPGLIVTADDVAHGKPAPDPYRAGADLLGLPPDRCAVFEDSTSGIAAARAAGVAHVVGVGRQSATDQVDLHVADLREVSWAAGLLRVRPARPGPSRPATA